MPHFLHPPPRSCQFFLNGSSAKGKLVRKSTDSSASSPLWLVLPDGKRRSEEVPERALGRLIIDDADAKPKQLRRFSTRVTASSNSDGSTEENGPKDPRISSATTTRSTRDSAAGTSSENSRSSKKRKSGDTDSSNTSSHKMRKVTFQDGKQTQRKKVVKSKSARLKGAGTSYGTRSTRAIGGELLSELPPPSKSKFTTKTSSSQKTKQDKYVQVIKMLTGTLYLYKGEMRKAEFVRSKY